MRTEPTETFSVRTSDGVEIRLRRYRGGSKGPVLVAHGAGVSSGMFALTTVEKPFVEFLRDHGYDTWLLDWRASTELPLRQFTLDEAAEMDFPAAVRFVKEKTGAPSIQAVVHCAGASTFFMSLAAGFMPEVRSVVCSQVALHADAPAPTQWKALLRLPDVLQRLDIASMSPDEDPRHPRFQNALGDIVDLVHHECASTVCHRITFMYGHLYRHDQLNSATHDRLNEQFGPCNMTTFRHLAQIVRRGSSAKFDYGKVENQRRYGTPEPPSYVHPEHLKLPILFVSGALNQTYLPSSTERTYSWLCKENGASLYRREVVPHYGHIDGFLGYRAERDTFPLFLSHLEATAS